MEDELPVVVFDDLGTPYGGALAACVGVGPGTDGGEGIGAGYSPGVEVGRVGDLDVDELVAAYGCRVAKSLVVVCGKGIPVVAVL